MGILLFIIKRHSCKTLKEVSKNPQLLSKNHFKIYYAPLMCSDLLLSYLKYALHKFAIALIVIIDYIYSAGVSTAE